ncbi:MAG: NACHT domain-containing protein [Symploca sp. SIO2D2]|nr:NACHT domain-containing protein [Symploca sp. SIO2D2]
MPEVKEEATTNPIIPDVGAMHLGDNLSIKPDIDNPNANVTLMPSPQLEGRKFSAEQLLNQTTAKKLVILGDPGIGKTTLMSYFAVMLARKQPEKLGLTAQVDWLPILLRIRDLARVPDIGILDFIEQFAQKTLGIATLPVGFFEHWLKEGKALILLDGLDEVANPAKREAIVDKIRCFLGQFQQNRAIITSRPAGYRRDFFHTTEFPHYWLQKFDQERIQLFIEQWYNSRIRDPKEAQRFKDSLREVLEEQQRIQLLAQNPLLLTIIALIHRYERYLPRKRYKLYDRAVKTLLTNWEKRKDVDEHWQLEYLTRDDLERLMKRLAYWIHCQGDTGDKEGGTLIDREKLISKLGKFIAKQKRLEPYQAKEEAKRFVQLVQNRAGLLNEQGQDYYAFVHKTFQEYLAAEEIIYLQENNNFKKVLKHIQQYLHNPHWREVLLLLIAQQKPKKATKVLKAILGHDTPYENWLHRNLFFAGSCLAEDIQVTDEDLVKEILQQLVELEISKDELVGENIRNQVRQKLYSLSKSRFEKQALELVKAAGDKVEEERLWKYQAELGEKEAVIEMLLGQLANKDSTTSAIEALVKLGRDSEKVHQALLELLKDNDKQMRISAAKALVKLGKYSEKVDQALLGLLKDENQPVRIQAIRALAQLGKYSEKVDQALLGLLTDENQPVRILAVMALAQLGKYSEKVHQALLGLLKDNDKQMRISAAKALGELGKDLEEVHQVLLKLLTDEDESVRMEVVVMLGQLGKDSEKVHQALLVLLKDNDKQMRISAAEALGELGKDSEEVHQVLLKLLTDEDESVRISAAEALVQLGKDSEEVHQALLKLLTDEDESVRISAAKALGQLGKDSEKVHQALLALLTDENQFMRFLATEALVQLGKDSEKVHQALLALLTDEDESVRIEVVVMLGQLGKDSEEVHQALLKLLTDENQFVRFFTARVLSDLGKKSSKVTPAVIHWIEQHQDSEYVGSGIDALWDLVVQD